MNRVVVTGTRIITSWGNDPHIVCEQALLNPQIEDYANFQKRCNYVENIKFNGKKLMNNANFLEVSNVLSMMNEINLSHEEKMQCAIYLGNQLIHPSQEMIDIFLKYCYENDMLSLEKIGKNIKKIPPLNGIRILSTIPSNFIAENLNIHGSGELLYTGENSGLTNLIMASKKIRYGELKQAIVASSYSEFEKCVYFWNDEKELKKGEGTVALFLESEESAKSAKRKILAYVGETAMNTFPDETPFNISDENILRNIQILLKKHTELGDNIDFLIHSKLHNKDNVKKRYKIETYNMRERTTGKLEYCGGLLDCVLGIALMEKKKEKSCIIGDCGIGGQYNSMILYRRNDE